MTNQSSTSDGAGVTTFSLETTSRRTGARLSITNAQIATAWKGRAAVLYVNGEARGRVGLDGVTFYGQGDILPGPFASLADAALSTFAYLSGQVS